MNKKFSTLMAAAMLATGVNGWAQVVIDGGLTLPADNSFEVQAVPSTGFNRFIQDNASSCGNDAFPAVSPFKLATAYGAKPIKSLSRVDGVADTRYFQFVVGGASASGTEVLTMVWVNSEGTLQNGGGYDPSVYHGALQTGEKGYYKIQIENVENANIPTNRITLDRTLWKVTANKDAAGTVLYYTLQNKATDAILQLSIENTIGAYPATSVSPAFTEVDLKVVNGQTNWRWADGKDASLASNVESGSNAPVVLQNQLRAQYNNGTTLILVKKTDSNGKITLGAIQVNSNYVFNGFTYTDPDGKATKYEPLTFEGWEANPIILTAKQINAELGNETYLTEDQKTKDNFRFVFDPDVEGDTNVMLSTNFSAVDAKKDGYDRVPGDAPDGFVRFVTKATKDKSEFEREYLRVDTAYYDPNANGRYDLKMAVSQILYPRYAVSKDKLKVDGDGYLTYSDGTRLSDEEIYGDVNAIGGPSASRANYTAKSFVQLKRQSNFRPIFYPSTQSFRLQAEMLYKADKTSSQPWWKQMADDATKAANSTPTVSYTPGTAGTADNYMRIAGCAEDPSVDPTYTPAKARGYYPAYAQDITTLDKGVRLIHYKNQWGHKELTIAKMRNGYADHGTSDLSTSTDMMLWNAVGNVLQGTNAVAKAIAPGTSFDGNSNVWVIDPASRATNGNWAALGSTPNEVTAATFTGHKTYAPQYATAQSNLVRLVSLTPNHIVLTAGIHDKTDARYNGLLTYITIQTTRSGSSLDEVADIQEGFYYIRNANTMTSDLMQVDDYRYEDLAATNAMFAYWNALTQKWDRGVSGLDGNNPDAEGINLDNHKADKANQGNLVYSPDKKVIPSAQWYIKGNGGYYTIYNRESGRSWGTSYWWKTNQPGVYVNLATYTDAAGLNQSYRDTIRIEAVAPAELTNRTLGYLYVPKEVAIADTSVFSVTMTNLGDTRFSLSEDKDGVLRMVQDEKGEYKLEKVKVTDKDIYSQQKQSESNLIYGYVPELRAGVKDTSKLLMRAKYYIYKDEVNANSGIEPSSIQTRKYITLESGKYRLTPVKVQFGDDLFSTNLEADEMAGTENVKNRRAFYIKQISTVDPSQYVVVDPQVVTQTANGVSSKTAYGARLFVNQLTAEVQPGSLISDGYANSYASSIFNVDQVQAYNYKDLRGEFSRDTLEFFKADDAAGNYLLSENSNVAGSSVGLLESLDKRFNKNNALFLDTANVSRPECPRFLLGLRNVDVREEHSSIPSHNRHLYTKAAYLVNMIDSANATANNPYYYKNIDQNATTCYRLGFLEGVHEGSTLTLDKSQKVFDLSDAALKENGLNYATFAFRFCDTDRDHFYIETMYDADRKGWLKTINHVLVVTPNIQEAEVFSCKKSEQTPTANEQIATSSVSVVAGIGTVTVQNAAGKNLTITNVLGKPVVNAILSSDNETISVPAGIVVVSVEGEASVKTVVK